MGDTRRVSPGVAPGRCDHQVGYTGVDHPIKEIENQVSKNVAIMIRIKLWSGIYAMVLISCGNPAVMRADDPVTLNKKDNGYRGIWYMNQPSGDEYVYKYSGGLGTYCAKHQPFAVYSAEAAKTFFCYGGASNNDSRRLLHMVSYFDHRTNKVPRPTILLDKQTSDAHDNPVIAVDGEGYIWIFSTSHGRKVDRQILAIQSGNYLG